MPRMRCRLDDEPAPVASVTPVCWCEDICEQDGFTKLRGSELSGHDGSEAKSGWREIEMVRLIDLLRSEEGDSVTILCDNPDPRNASENNAVVCNGYWTEWNDRRFSGIGLLDALSAAMIEYKRQRIEPPTTSASASPADGDAA